MIGYNLLKLTEEQIKVCEKHKKAPKKEILTKSQNKNKNRLHILEDKDDT